MVFKNFCGRIVLLIDTPAFLNLSPLTHTQCKSAIIVYVSGPLTTSKINVAMSQASRPKHYQWLMATVERWVCHLEPELYWDSCQNTNPVTGCRSLAASAAVV